MHQPVLADFRAKKLKRRFHDRLARMCNLYTERKSAAEVAAHFGVDLPVQPFSTAGEIYPAYPDGGARWRQTHSPVEELGLPAPFGEQTHRPSEQAERDEQRARPQALDDLALVGHLSNAARALGRSAEPRPEW
jgi:hypothetical protein